MNKNITCIRPNQGNFNNKIHLYVRSKKDDEITNHINFIKTSNYTLDYDIIKDTIEDESFFTRINNFEELKIILNYYKNIKGYKINIDYFINELLKINSKSINLMFHYKFYNNSIGIYFINNDINIVNNFLKIYNYPIKIDILFDLNGHTENSRLDIFSLNPAPIQISYLGYPNTTGLKSIRYRIVDSTTDPVSSTQKCSETLIRLPKCFLLHKNFK
jgi:hypothetical protein